MGRQLRTTSARSRFRTCLEFLAEALPRLVPGPDFKSGGACGDTGSGGSIPLRFRQGAVSVRWSLLQRRCRRLDRPRLPARYRSGDRELFVTAGVASLNTPLATENFGGASRLIELLGCTSGCDSDLRAQSGIAARGRVGNGYRDRFRRSPVRSRQLRVVIHASRSSRSVGSRSFSRSSRPSRLR